MSPLPPPAVVPEPDRLAWEALVRRHSRAVWLTLLAQGCTNDQAQELTQETWARLWARHRLGVLERLELPGLAITQAKFLWADARRHQGRSPVAPGEAGAEAEAGPGAEERLVSAQALRAVRRELEGLSARDRQVLELAQEGVAHAEIAERLALTPRRVRQLVWELRCRLRASLGALP